MGKDVRKKRTYSEIMKDVQKASYGKERRILHKELKESYGEGLPLFMRYPDLPMIVSIISLVAATAILLLTVLVQLWK